VPVLSDEAVAEFRRTRRQTGISPVVAHGSYLVNLAGEPHVRGRSIEAMVADLDRCRRLGIEYLVFHPGSRPDKEEGIRLIAEGLNEILARVAGSPMILLETTAGMGNSIGHTFEQLAAILARIDSPRRAGVCLDTCHIFAAGYDIRTPQAYQRTMADFDRIIGLDRLHAVHVNDSLKGLGCHLDRHVHIGKGKIGRRGFRNLLTDQRLANVPMILETPKGEDDKGRDWDALNAAVLRRMARASAKKGQD
jgi:deoxyribonuclease-4